MRKLFTDKLIFTTSTDYYEKSEFPIEVSSEEEGEPYKTIHNFDELMDLLEEIDQELKDFVGS